MADVRDGLLVDFRGKLTARAHQVLLAEARAADRDLSEIVRHVLDLWAQERIRAATLIVRLSRVEGIAGDSGG
ncbi:MAG: hypothetical protein QJR02_08265 [Sinobacteraceae bacterium]|nr:hypothetical protein [Nevskiaceae bacterium]